MANIPADPDSLDACERRFRLFIEMMPHLAWTASPFGAIDFCNQRWCRYTGLTVAETLHPALPAVLHPEDVGLCAGRWKEALESGMPYEVECRLRRASDGMYRWHLGQVSPMWDIESAHGGMLGWCGTFTEIDDRKRGVEEVRDLERFLESIVDNMPDAVFVKDAAELRFVRVNKAMEDLVGFTSTTAIGKNDFDFFPKQEAEFFISKDRAVLAGGELLEIPDEPMHTPSGTKILHTKKIPILDSRGKPLYLLGIARDITARKRAQEELQEKNRLLQESARSEHEALQALKTAQTRLVQSEKMASLGQLVAGVAHEINNPLAFVANNHAVLARDLAMLCDLLRMYQAVGPKLADADPAAFADIAETAERIDLAYTLTNLPELLARSRDGLKRIQKIVLDLREFSRHDSAADRPEEADLNTGLQSTANMIQGRARSREIRLELDLAPLPRVNCYAAKINQVVMNLLANAIDACEAGGQVTLRSRAVDGGIELQVIDTGHGIDPEIVGKIFDPFFTTKPQGEGTGMGLSISYGIISEHGGKISVESTLGSGTCFTIHLPLGAVI